MNSYLNCIFWNIKDALPPNQRKTNTTRTGETAATRQNRETKQADNRERAPRLVEAIVRIAARYQVDLFLFAEYHLDQSMDNGDRALLRTLEQQTGRRFSRLPNPIYVSQESDGRIEFGKEKAIAVFSSLELRETIEVYQQLDVVHVPSDPLNEEPFDEARLTLRALYLPGEASPI